MIQLPLIINKNYKSFYSKQNNYSKLKTKCTIYFIDSRLRGNDQSVFCFEFTITIEYFIHSCQGGKFIELTVEI